MIESLLDCCYGDLAVKLTAALRRVVTKGIVQEKQQARDTYNQAVAQGDGAQLLEQKRTDVFELVCQLLLSFFLLVSVN